MKLNISLSSFQQNHIFPFEWIDWMEVEKENETRKANGRISCKRSKIFILLHHRDDYHHHHRRHVGSSYHKNEAKFIGDASKPTHVYCICCYLVCYIKRITRMEKPKKKQKRTWATEIVSQLLLKKSFFSLWHSIGEVYDFDTHTRIYARAPAHHASTCIPINCLNGYKKRERSEKSV